MIDEQHAEYMRKRKNAYNAKQRDKIILLRDKVSAANAAARNCEEAALYFMTGIETVLETLSRISSDFAVSPEVHLAIGSAIKNFQEYNEQAQAAIERMIGHINRMESPH